MPKVLQLKWFRALVIVAALVGLYALIGFEVAPGIVRSQAVSFVKEQYHRDLRIGEVRINPFLLQIELNDLSLPDADGSPMLGFKRLFVDFEVASLWERAYVFKEVILAAPDLRAVIRAGGALNLVDLVPKGEPAAKQQPSELPSVWLQSLVVSGGAIGFADRSRAKPFVRRFTPVSFTLKDFRTTPEGGGFQLSALSEAGEGFDWKGRFEVEPSVASQGEMKIHGLKAQGIGEYLGDALPFGLSSGLVDIAGRYEVKTGEALGLKFDLARISVTDLGLRARGADADWVQVPSITISDTVVALPARTVSIGGVAVADMKVQAWMAPDGSVNLTQLFAPTAGVAAANVAATSAGATDAPAAAATDAGGSAGPVSPATPSPSGGGSPAPQAGAARAWTVKVASTDVTNATIDFEDRLKDPVKQFVVAPLNVQVRGASLDLAQPVQVSANAVVNGVAPFKADGTVTPEPLAADLAIALNHARMQILQPYVLPVADLTITNGLLTMEGRVRLAPPDPGPRLRFDGEVAIDDFASVDNALKKDLVNFKSVELHKLSYAMGPDAASIDQVLVEQPFARVIISPGPVLNIAAVLDPKGTAAALEARRAEAAAEAAMTPAERRRREQEREAAEKQAEKGRKGHAPAAQELPPLPIETMPVRIREVRIRNGTLDFTDNNVQPNFSARVQKVGGTVSGLSSDPKSHAKVDLAGNVGEFSPVKITGEVQPFSFERYADIGLKFENISLPIFNPYSGRFAGYSIARGKLTTDLHYLIQDRRLDAQHKIRIDQLEWGEATAAKGEATLPVKFATVLLRDRDGVINLDIPVKGTLGDPTFRVGPIVWMIIKNLIVKAVTAPFALLGALFSGAEEAQFVDFPPGSAVLDPPTVERLGSLAKSLVEKPGLRLDVPIGVLPEVDGPALKEIAYQAALSDAMSATLGKRRKEGAPAPSFDTLEPDQKIDVLTALVKKQTGARPEVPEPPEPPEGTSRSDAKAMRQDAAITFLKDEAMKHVVVPEAEYGQLGEQRAAAIQHALLDGGQLEPARVFPVRDGKVTTQDGKVRFQLGLQ